MKEKYKIYFRIPFTWYFLAKVKVTGYDGKGKDKALFCFAVKKYIEAQKLYQWQFLL